MQGQKPKKNDFGPRFQAARKAAGLDRAQLAAKLGLRDPSQISRYEAGKSYPTVPTLLEISKLLPVDLHWLLTGKTSPAAAKEAEKYHAAVDELKILAHYLTQDTLHRRGVLLDEKEAIVDRLAKTGDQALISQLQDIERRTARLKKHHEERIARVNNVLKSLGDPDSFT
ncbi:MAG: helix-turn-helix transcriptional regulator [Phycisphaerae bacterium]|nr:helix-turn-helix transcriptional regulator [Phycisphaerae bacterium]